MSAAPPSNGSVDKWVEITKVGHIIKKKIFQRTEKYLDVKVDYASCLPV